VEVLTIEREESKSITQKRTIEEGDLEDGVLRTLERESVAK